jgi:hypothetical protein
LPGLLRTILFMIMNAIAASLDAALSFDAGWSSPVARQAHNLKVVSSNLAPATKKSEIVSIAYQRPRSAPAGGAFAFDRAPRQITEQANALGREALTVWRCLPALSEWPVDHGLRSHPQFSPPQTFHLSSWAIRAASAVSRPVLGFAPGRAKPPTRALCGFKAARASACLSAACT